MHLDVAFLPSEIGNLSGRAAVVIDVLRATTTVVTALDHGCQEILPVDQPDEAIDLARQIGSDHLLIGGERKGRKIEGFDLGNSPLEYTHEVMAGHKVILCTTNGTRTIRRAAAAQGRPVILAAMVNVGAVIETLAKAAAPATVICSGREDFFALEDAICAGLIVKQLLSRKGWQGTDAARAAAALWDRFGGAKLAASLAKTDHGSYLVSIGFEADVAYAAEMDTSTMVPVLREGCLVPLEKPS